MALVSQEKTLPKHKPGWQVWGTTKRNELVGLGEFARLSIGQRLFGTYAQFYHVDMRPQPVSLKVEARSATGELYFTVTFEGIASVDPNRVAEVLHVDDPIATFLEAELTYTTRELGQRYPAEDKEAFQQNLQQVVNPRQGGTADLGPIVLQRIDVLVQRPSELGDEKEFKAVMRGLEAKIILAESRGQTKTAELLRKAYDTGKGFEYAANEEIINTAEQATRMGEFISILERADDPDPQLLKLAKGQHKTMLANGPAVVSSDGEEEEKPAKSKEVPEDSD